MTEQQLGEQWREMAKTERRRHAAWSGQYMGRSQTDAFKGRNASVLEAIADNPGLSARELCDLLEMKSTTLRSKLDRLKRDGKIYAKQATVTHKQDFRCNVWFCVD